MIANLNNHILQNNLFGVDLNEESVEITKLSLWLKTASKSSELTSLDNNIKCGNSLIDHPAVAGKKAFNWNEQFGGVFHRGGFDIIIGNPPYVQFAEYKDYYSKNYKVFECRDLYTLFIEKSVKLLQSNGSLGFIIPSLFIKNVQYFSLREFLVNNVQISEIKEMGDKVFNDVKMPTAIITLKNKITVNQNWDDFLQNSDVIKNIEKQTFKIQDLTEIMRGLEIGKDKLSSKSDYKILAGEDIKRYEVSNISYISEATYNEFKKNKDFFSGERLYIRETGERINCIYLEDENILCTRSLYSIKAKNKDLNLKYLLAIINSQVVQNYYSAKYKANTNIFPKIRIIQVKQIPIPNISLFQQKPFIEIVDFMNYTD